MTNLNIQETFKEILVTYTLEIDGKFYIIKNVPARECLETGEHLYSPERVEKLQQIIWKKATPKHYLQVPVYEFSPTLSTL